MKLLVVSCSLHPESNSFALAQHAATELRTAGADVEFIDLRQHTLPICDGETCTNPSVESLTRHVASADAILLAVPIYNFDVNAAAKNLVEHTGSAWEGKIVGFLAAAGGHASYMSLMPLANSLMLDFRCLIVPRFVYATGADFADGRVTSAKIAGRIAQLATETLRLAGALRVVAQSATTEPKDTPSTSPADNPSTGPYGRKRDEPQHASNDAHLHARARSTRSDAVTNIGGHRHFSGKLLDF